MRLEEARPSAVPLQAYDISWRTNQEQWLADYAPKEFARYKSFTRACGSLVWASMKTETNSYIVRDSQERARGIGRVLLNESVEHPRLGSVKGTFIDYWLDERASDDMHLYVPRTLTMEASVKKLGKVVDPRDALSHEIRYGGLPVFATVPTEYSYNFGLRSHMVALGEPAKLEHEGKDPYDIAREGQIGQIYVNEHILLR